MRKGPETDVLVVGAGIYGLACARAAARRGLKVLVVDRVGPGSGASGGLVGALSPHAPDAWSPLKAFQHDALIAAGSFWNEIGQASGLDPGFGRVGRVIPLSTAEARDRAEVRAAAAARNWRLGAWRVLPPSDVPEWIAPAEAPFGAVYETLSARVHPRHAIASLAGAATTLGVQFRSGIDVERIEAGHAHHSTGTIEAPAIVVAAGAASGSLVAPHAGRALVRGVKGQAALLLPVRSLSGPMLYRDGLYVVPHSDGRVAVGSTSETSFAEEGGTDDQLEHLIEAARRTVPALRDSLVAERWSGLRPRAPRPDPLIGLLPGCPGVLLATGGFRTGFATAPLVAEAVADMLAGRAVALPPGFTVAEQLGPG